MQTHVETANVARKPFALILVHRRVVDAARMVKSVKRVAVARTDSALVRRN